MVRIVMTELRRIRRWPRLRLRSRVWLVAVLLAGGALAWLSDQPRRRVRAIGAAKHAGGYATLDNDHDPMKPPAANPPQSPIFRWLTDQLGPGVGHEVTLINLDAKPVTDADLASLSGLRGLRILYLNATPITDRSLRHLDSLTGLQKLELRETAIGDAGLAHLSGLHSLRALYLHSTQVTDAGMIHLTPLKKLRELHLGRTAIGDAALPRLAELVGLEELYLEHTNITDEGLVALESMANLRYLSLDGTRVTRAGIANLNDRRAKRGLPGLTTYRFIITPGRPGAISPSPPRVAPLPPDSQGFEAEHPSMQTALS
jgi:Leucine Rich repeat